MGHRPAKGAAATANRPRGPARSRTKVEAVPGWVEAQRLEAEDVNFLLTNADTAWTPCPVPVPKMAECLVLHGLPKRISNQFTAMRTEETRATTMPQGATNQIEPTKAAPSVAGPVAGPDLWRIDRGADSSVTVADVARISRPPSRSLGRHKRPV